MRPYDDSEERAAGLMSAALALAEQGYAVFPLHSVSNGVCTCRKGKQCTRTAKHPRCRNGLHDATHDHALIRAWWQKWPNANIGIATGAVSGVFVVDIDPPKGGDRSLRELIQEHGGTIDYVALVKTGSGGTHYYMRQPEDMRTQNRQNCPAPGIDIRGDGGYVVAPPSVHASGRLYEWA